MTRALSLWAPVVLYMAVIFFASSQPDVPLPPGLGDKPTHSLAYLVLGVLMARALVGGLGERVSLSSALLAVALTTAYGASDEIHQMFVPGRFADWNDLVADAIGGAGGAFTCWLWGILLPAPRHAGGTSRHGL